MNHRRLRTAALAGLASTGLLLLVGAATAADAGIPTLDVKSVALTDAQLKAAISGKTIAQKGEWPFAFYMDPSGKFEGWYAEDKPGNEQGKDKVKDSGPWVVKNNQVCITFNTDEGGVQVDCRYLVKVGSHVMVFDPKGKLLYPEVALEAGKKL